MYTIYIYIYIYYLFIYKSYPSSILWRFYHLSNLVWNRVTKGKRTQQLLQRPLIPRSHWPEPSPAVGPVQGLAKKSKNLWQAPLALSPSRPCSTSLKIALAHACPAAHSSTTPGGTRSKTWRFSARTSRTWPASLFTTLPERNVLATEKLPVNTPNSLVTRSMTFPVLFWRHKSGRSNVLCSRTLCRCERSLMLAGAASQVTSTALTLAATADKPGQRPPSPAQSAGHIVVACLLGGAAGARIKSKSCVWSLTQKVIWAWEARIDQDPSPKDFRFISSSVSSKIMLGSAKSNIPTSFSASSRNLDKPSLCPRMINSEAKDLQLAAWLALPPSTCSATCRIIGKSRSENRIWGPLLPLAFSSWGLPFCTWRIWYYKIFGAISASAIGKALLL